MTRTTKGDHAAVNDWEQFLREVPWFLQPGQNPDVGTARPGIRTGVDVLPDLSTLLDAATLTPVSINGTTYELLTWGTPNERRGWLCQPPRYRNSDDVPQIHTDL